MAGNDTAALIVALEAKLDKFDKDMSKARGTADRTVRGIEDRFAKMNPGANLSRLFALLGGAGLATGIQRAVHELAQLGDLAERIGTTTDALQTLRFVVGQNGGEAADADAAMQKFADTVGEAAVGTSYLRTVFEANNIALRDQAGNLRSLDAMLIDFARVVAGAGSGQEKMMLVTEAFGRRAGPQMLLALQEIATKGLPGLIAASRDAGVVIEQELIEKARKFDDAWEAAMTKAGAETKSLLIETLTAAGGLLTEMFNKLQDLSGVRLLGGRTRGDELDEESKPLKVSAGPGAFVPLKEFEQAREAIEKRTRALASDAAAVGAVAGEQERLRAAMELTNVLTEAGVVVNDAYRARINEVSAALGKATLEQEVAKARLADLNQGSRELGSALSSAFQGAVLEGQKLNEVLSQLLNRLASRSIDKLFELFFAPQAGAATSSFTSLLTGLFGGARAEGGDVSPGRAYVVGERGAELFVPKAAGVIVPNHARAPDRGGAPRIVINNLTGERVETRQQSGPAGDLTEITIGVLNRAIASGRADGAMSRFGLRPSVARR